MQPGYPYHPPQGLPGASPVRTQSPPSSTSASDPTTVYLPGPTDMVSLPPLRGLDPHGMPPASSLYGAYHQHQHQHHHHHPQHHLPPHSPHHPLSPMQQQPAYFQPQVYQQHAQTLPLPQQQMMPQHYLPVAPPPTTMRYAQIPAAPDSRSLFGRSTRKEIKRRTKTGCLTCRKRRIKCDEQHPVCRNCQKSKRECAGYETNAQQTSSTKGPSSTGGANSSAPSVSSGQQTPSPTTKAVTFSSSGAHRDSVTTDSGASGRSGTNTPVEPPDYYAGQRYGAVHPPHYPSSEQYHSQHQARPYYPESSTGASHHSQLEHGYGNQ